MASIKRRLRQAREHFGFAAFSAMQESLLHDPEMLPRLLAYLTVQVSEMFRDPAYFRAIREKVAAASAHLSVAQGLDRRLQQRRGALFLRHPVPRGGAGGRTLFYATDINQDALAKAEAGVYDLDRMQLFTENHRNVRRQIVACRIIITAAYGGASFDKSLRKRVVFSDHSLVTDAVFAEMQLISCRNVLIYFDRALQDRALGLFKDSLAAQRLSGAGLQGKPALLRATRTRSPNSCARRKSTRSASA